MNRIIGVLKPLLVVTALAGVLSACHGQLQPATRVNHAEHAVAMEPQDWFVDIEAAWWDRPDREALLETLTAQGVLTGVLIADLFPITEPEWSDRGNRENFPPWARAHLRSFHPRG